MRPTATKARKTSRSQRERETPRRLLLEGGFVVDGGRDRRLKERAGVLGHGMVGVQVKGD
jgi:hypothetical protein